MVPKTKPEPELRIEYMRLDALRRAPRNPQGHDLPVLESSMERFGYVDPMILDEASGAMVAGHGRLETLEEQKARGSAVPRRIRVDTDGEWLVPVLRGVDFTDAEEAEAYLLAANRITRLGVDDDLLLAEMLESLAAGAGLEGTGFDDTDLADLLDRVNAADEPDPKMDPSVPPVPVDPVTQPGDVWLLGDHRIMCGDARDADQVAHLLDGATINLAFTSPPYADHRKYDESTTFRPIPPGEYVEWFAPIAERIADHLAPDGSWFVNIKPGAEGLDTDLYVHDLVAAHVRQWGWHFLTEFCWERVGVPKNVTMRFKNQFEPIFQFVRDRFKFHPAAVAHESDNAIIPLGPGAGNASWGDDPNSTVPGQGSGGNMFARNMAGSAPDGPRPRKNSQGSTSNADSQGQNWEPGEALGHGMAYPGNRLPSLSGTHEATGHSAAFPVGLPDFFVRAYTDEGDNVYDPFMGSGSTLLAAHQNARVGFGMEISPAYCDIIATRFQEHTGIRPRRPDGSEHSFTFED